MTNRILVVLNSLTLAIMLLANYLFGASVLSDVTVADVSHKYDTLFAPAGYAFIIWGLIFLMCTGFVGYQWVLLKKNDPARYIQRCGPWFIISNLANAFWLYCWTNEWLGWSVAVIIVLLFSLCILTMRLRLELNDEPVLTIFFVWWPIAFYLGWVMVATIACIASWLVYLGWKGGSINEDVWTIMMIAIACLLYIFLVAKRNLREAAVVGIWAFIAIAARQWQSNVNITTAASIAAATLLVAISIHGFKNRYYSPFAKMKRNEWS